MPSDTIFDRLPALMVGTRKAGLITTNGTGVTGLGDTATAEGTASATAVTATEGVMRNSVTPSAASGQAMGDHGNANYRTGRNIRFAASVKLVENAVERVWIGMSDAATVAAQGASDTVAGNYACFRYSTTAPDANWKCITMNGVTQTVVDSGIAVDTGVHKFEVIFNDSVPNVVFKIDGKVVATITTNLPSAATALRFIVGGQTLEAVLKNIRYEWIYVEADR